VVRLGLAAVFVWAAGGYDPSASGSRYAADILRDLALLAAAVLLAWRPASRFALLHELNAEPNQEPR
jgi:hypothetical protein